MSSPASQVLRNRLADLVRLLVRHRVNLLHLSQELQRNIVLTKASCDKFASLDLDRLQPKTTVRYLLREIIERVSVDENSFARLVDVLCELQGEVGVLGKNLNKEVADMTADSGSTGAELGSDELLLTGRNIRDIAKLMVEGSHKWEEIGVCLGVPEYKRDEFKYAGGSNPFKLYKLLVAWISGDFKGAKSLTLGSIKTALSSGLVQLPDVANKLDTYSGPPAPSSSPKRPRLNSVPEIEYQSCDTEVAEGKSTLLEVRVSCSGSEYYQWSKDGKPLSDGDNFSGVNSNMLFINKATHCTEGNYSCCVSETINTTSSDEMKLSVIYPLEKRKVLKIYSNREEVPENSWPYTENSTFTNLVLVKQKTIRLHNYFTIHGNMDLGSKEVVAYEEVFKVYREGALVLIEGRPGSGKTTLVHKLSRDWENGEKILQGAKMVFLITLRLLNVDGKDKSLVDLLQIFNYSEDLVRDLNSCEGKGVCFILDGLDEYHIKRNNSVITKLLSEKYLSSSMVIVASRPVATEKLKKKSQLRIEVMGFSNSHIFHYVEKYHFHDPSMARKMVEYLNRHPNVLRMCYLPVHAATICSLFSELEDNIPDRETQIYEKLTIATILRHRRRDQDTNSQIRSLNDLYPCEKILLRFICKLAYDMLVQSQQVVKKSVIQLSSDSFLGLLTVERVSILYSGIEEFYTFHHLTFQEFLAARYMYMHDHLEVRLISEANSKNTLKFYCKSAHSDKNIDLAKLICDSKLFLDKVQSAFESQQVNLCDHVIDDHIKLINEGITSTDFIALGLVALGLVSSRSSKIVEKITLSHCTWDSEGVEFFTSMVTEEKLNSIKCLKVDVDNDESFAALHSLLGHLPSLEELDLTTMKLEEYRIESLTNAIKLPCLEVLKITLPLIPPCSNPEEVLKLLAFGSKNLKQVHYSVHDDHIINYIVWKEILNCAFGDQTIQDNNKKWLHLYNLKIVFSQFQARCSCLIDVAIVNCCIDDAGAVTLAETFNASLLENLVLDFNRISDSGAVELAFCIKKCNGLQVVSIQCNSIGDSGATALAKALDHCNSLKKLNLQGNRSLGDEGAVAIAEATKNLPSLDLLLYNENITEEGIKRVLEHRVNTRIRSMVLSSIWGSIKDIAAPNHDTLLSEKHGMSIRGINFGTLTNDTVQSQANLIKQYTNLQHIECDFGSINDDNVELISNSLKSNKSLHSSLFSLVLHGGSLHSCILLDALKYCTALCSLDLSRCKIEKDEVNCLCHDHKSWSYLHTLNLRCNNIGSEGAQVLGKWLGLKYNKTLRCLNLEDNDIGDSGAVAIAEGLKDYICLLELILGNNSITKKGLDALSSVVRQNQHLQHLDLSFCSFGSEGVERLKVMLCKNYSLQTLNLSNSELTGDHMKILCNSELSGDHVKNLCFHLRNSTQLVELDLSYNHIGSQGVAYLAEGLQFCNRLGALDLPDNDITSDSVSALIDILKKCKNLHRLDLFCNNIGIDGAADLIDEWKNKSVLTLCLDFCFENTHKSALENGENCCNSCERLLAQYYKNDYVHIQLTHSLPKLLSLHNLSHQ